MPKNSVIRFCRGCGESWEVCDPYGQSWVLCPSCRYKSLEREQKEEAMYVVKDPGPKETYDNDLYLKNIAKSVGLSYWTEDINEAKIYDSIGDILYETQGIDDCRGARKFWQIAKVEKGTREVEVL